MKLMMGGSIVWILAGVLVLVSSAGCETSPARAVIACLTANELGDFLAGVFAPLAFAWLAYAVVIQSKELAAQKEELRLTRKEMELTRKVAIEAKDATRAQAEEARRSAELFKSQTQLMEEGKKRDQEARSHDDFDHLVSSLYESILSAANMMIPPEENYIRRSSGVSGFRAALGSCIDTFAAWQFAGSFELSEAELRGFVKAFHVSKAFEALLPGLSKVDKLVYEEWGISKFNAKASEIASSLNPSDLADFMEHHAMD